MCGQTIICPTEELHDRLSVTATGKKLIGEIELTFHRFGCKTTVCHLLHKPTDTAFVGVSYSPDVARFNKKAGRDLSLRDACAKLTQAERYHRKWLVRDCPTLPST